MATQKQIEANRRNARRSTGPCTAEGKARSSRNRRTHGLCALPLPDIHDGDFRHYLEMFTERHLPRNREEATIVCAVALCWWERDHVDRAEHGIFARLSAGKNSADPATREAAWARFSRELGTLNRVADSVYNRLYEAEDQWLIIEGASPEDIAELHLDDDEECDEADLEDDDLADEGEAGAALPNAEAEQARETARAEFLRDAVRIHFAVVANIGAGTEPPRPALN